MYFNTTNLKGKDLNKEVKKAKTQNEKIIEYFKTYKIASASILFKSNVLSENTPITSYRRSLTFLSDKNILYKTDIRKMGLFGKNEYCYKLKK